MQKKAWFNNKNIHPTIHLPGKVSIIITFALPFPFVGVSSVELEFWFVGSEQHLYGALVLLLISKSLTVLDSSGKLTRFFFNTNKRVWRCWFWFWSKFWWWYDGMTLSLELFFFACAESEWKWVIYIYTGLKVIEHAVMKGELEWLLFSST